MGHDVMMWLAISLSVPYLQAAVEAIPHLWTVEQNKTMPVQRQLSLPQDERGRYIPNGLELMLQMKVHK